MILKLNSGINTSEKINNLPLPPAEKRRDVKKKAEPPPAENTGVKIEINAHALTDGDGRAPNAVTERREAARGTEGSFITGEDIFVFAEAYNRLPPVLGEDFAAVRAEVYKPVVLNGHDRQISLYEIGVAHSPNDWREGMLSVDEAALTASLKERGADVHALFLQESGGLLQRLCSLVSDKRGTERFLRVCEGIIGKYDKIRNL